MRKLYLVVAGLMLVQPLAMAKGRDGNGGDAIVCDQPSQPRVQMYDFYEGREKHGMDRDLGPETSTLEQKFDYVMKRLERINPSRAGLYREWFKTFIADTEWLEGKELVDIPDTGDGYLPSGCVLKQLAIQREPKFPGEKRYTVNKDLWDQMDVENRVGLITHELILREMTSVARHTNSINTRYFNALIASKRLETMTRKAYFELMVLLEAPSADSKMVPIALFSYESEEYGGQTEPLPYEFFDVETVSKGVADRVQSFSWSGQKVKGTSQYDGPSEFHRNGVPAKLHLDTLGQAISYSTPHAQVTFKGVLCTIELFPEGSLKHAWGNACKVSFQVQGAQSASGSINFHPNGVPHKVYSWSGKLSVPVNGRDLPVTYIEYTPGYKIRSVTVGGLDPQVLVGGAEFPVTGELTFHESGAVEKLVTRGTYARIQGKNVYLHGKVEFYPSSSLRSVFIGHRTKLKNIHGKKRDYYGTTRLDERGYVIE